MGRVKFLALLVGILAGLSFCLMLVGRLVVSGFEAGLAE